MEAECGDLLRLLGEGGNGLQRLYAGVPLEPCTDISPPCRYIHGGEKPMVAPFVFYHG